MCDIVCISMYVIFYVWHTQKTMITFGPVSHERSPPADSFFFPLNLQREELLGLEDFFIQDILNVAKQIFSTFLKLPCVLDSSRLPCHC